MHQKKFVELSQNDYSKIKQEIEHFFLGGFPISMEENYVRLGNYILITGDIADRNPDLVEFLDDGSFLGEESCEK